MKRFREICFCFPVLIFSTIPCQAAPTSALSTVTTVHPTAEAVAIRIPNAMLAEVDRLDRVAHEKQLMLKQTADDVLSSRFVSNYRLLADEERQLDNALDSTWTLLGSQFNLQLTGAAFVNEPLYLAMLELQVELRRALGPVYHTAVPGLETDAGCAGDVIAERLVYRYGSIAASPGVSTQVGRDDITAVLARFAVQMACLGAKQAFRFESAFEESYARVERRLADSGFAALTPSLVRLVAPLQVLLFDTTKHAGRHSAAWQWFDRYETVLQQQVSGSGWIGNRLFVWDRRRAVLVGLSPCRPGGSSSGCVDFAVLLQSLRDPRALGLGHCAFAAMISQPAVDLGGNDYYVCPQQVCNPAEAASPLDPFGSATVNPSIPVQGGIGSLPNGGAPDPNSYEGRLDQRWGPNLSGAGRFDAGRLCGNGNMDFHSLNYGMEDCFDLPGTNNEDPFTTHAQCMLDAMGTGGGFTSTSSDAHLWGVPMGLHCGLAGEGGGGNEDPKGTPPPKDAEKKEPEPDPKEPEKEEPKPDPKTPEEDDKPGDSQWPDSDPPKEPEPPTVEEVNRFIMEADGEISTSEKIFLWVTENIIQPLFGPSSGGSQDCADGFGCSDDCTALGRQIQAVTACTEALWDQLSQLAGLPGKKDLTRRLDWVSKPNPESDTGGGSDIGICLHENGPGQRQTACGLMLCSDGSFAADMNGVCICSGSGMQMSIPSMCLSIRCADGTLPDENCNCTGAGEYEPTLPGIDPWTDSREIWIR